MLKVVRDGRDSVQPLMKALLKSAKGSLRTAVQEAMTQVGNDSLEPLFVLLDEVAASDTSSFYVYVFVCLLKFFSEKKEDHLDDEPETIVFNLLRDLAITPGSMTALENQGNIRVVSIVSSTVFPGMVNPISDSDSPRNRYAHAAVFIGTRVFYLLRVHDLTAQENDDFWTTGVNSLRSFCGRSLVSFQSILPRLLLPALNWQDEKEIAVTSHQTLEMRDERAVGDAAQHDVSDLSSLKPKELRAMLMARELPTYGSREALLHRLLKKPKDPSENENRCGRKRKNSHRE